MRTHRGEFFKLFEPHRAALQRYVDAFQDAASTTCRRFGAFAPGSDFRTWISRILTNMILNANSRHPRNVQARGRVVRGYKFEKAVSCVHIGQTAICQGSFKGISDEEGHRFPRGIAVRVCTDTAAKLTQPSYAGQCVVTDSTRAAPAGFTGYGPERSTPGCR